MEVTALATRPFPTVQGLMYKARKRQSLFKDKTSRVVRHKLMASLPSEDVIRINSALDEGRHPSNFSLLLLIYSIVGIQGSDIPSRRYSNCL